MNGSRSVRRRRAPRHWAAEGVVDLDGRRVAAETGHLGPHLRRQLIEGDQPAVEMLGGYIGQHRATGPHKLIMNLYANRTAVINGDLGHLGVADHLSPVTEEAVAHRLRELAGTPSGTGNPTV